MTEKENKDFLEILESYKEDVLKSKKSSQQFLKDLGVVTDKGNLSKNYKNLCIQRDQA